MAINMTVGLSINGIHEVYTDVSLTILPEVGCK